MVVSAMGLDGLTALQPAFGGKDTARQGGASLGVVCSEPQRLFEAPAVNADTLLDLPSFVVTSTPLCVSTRSPATAPLKSKQPAPPKEAVAER